MRKLTLATLGLTVLLAGCAVPGMPANEESTEAVTPAVEESITAPAAVVPAPVAPAAVVPAPVAPEAVAPVAPVAPAAN